MPLKKTVSFSIDAVNVFFHILTECNLKCRHCYINPDQHGTGMLPLPVIEKWLLALKGERRNANLILLGGEPTLHPDLSRIITAGRKMGYATITVDTNGYLFHDILSKVGPDDVDFFQLQPGRGNSCNQRPHPGQRMLSNMSFRNKKGQEKRISDQPDLHGEQSQH